MARTLHSCLTLLAIFRVQSQEIILQDEQAIGFSSSAATCAAGNGGSFKHNGGQFEETFSNLSDKTFFEYHFEPTKSGCYKIEEWHPVDASTCGVSTPPDVVPIRVDFCKGGVAHTTVAQNLRGGQWNTLLQLPFYVGYPGKIAIRDDGNQWPDFQSTCQGGRCLWMADAFKLTWLASTCSEADAEAKKQAMTDAETTESLPPTAAEQVENELEAMDQIVEATPVTSAAPMAAVQVVLSQPERSGDKGVFYFDAPYDGCYIIEEHHPSTPDASREILEVNYCKGMQSLHHVDHADGRHHQWNYVNSLPFFNGHRGSVVMPWRLLQERHDHDFRFTFVGPRCNARRAQPYNAKVRITAPFSNVPRVVQELSKFKTDILKLLSTATKVHHSRTRVTSLHEGSIIADVLVLPPMSQDGLVSRSDAIVDARGAVANLKAVLDTPGNSLATKLCELAKGGQACSVSIVASGPAAPLPSVDTNDKTDKAKISDKYVLLGLLGCGGILACVFIGVLACCVCARRGKGGNVDVEAGGNAKGEAAKVVPTEVAVASKSHDTIEKNAEIASNASTVTPDLEIAGNDHDGMLANFSDNKSEGSTPSVVVANTKSPNAEVAQ